MFSIFIKKNINSKLSTSIISEYEENIKTVDSGISKIEGLIEKFYNFDNQTSYIFTADHGMTDWGI